MTTDNINVKFLIAYHKPDILFKNDMLIPIHVGRALLRKRAEEDETARSNLQFLEAHMIGDDTGDNISLKNSSYNELTALYWAWKNYDKIGNPTHIGLMHYRRHFIFKDLENTFNECNDIGNDYFSYELNFSRESVETILCNNDFIAKKPAKFSSVKDAYLANHRPENLETAITILKELFPQYAASCDKYLNGKDCYYLNMFVFPKTIFFEYCTYIFSVLGEFEKRVDTSRMRFFISEFLTGIFIQYLCDSGHKGAFYPTMYIEEHANVPVVYCITKSNLTHASVSINSLLKNLKPTSTCVLHLVCAESDKYSVNEIVSRISNNYTNLRIEFMVLPEGGKNVILDDLLIYSLNHIAYNKAIFMSANTICKGDLTGFFRNSVDDYAIAGARAYNVTSDSEVSAELSKLGLLDNKHYIDTDVMLVNINRLKQFDLIKALTQIYANGEHTAEQLINSICYDQIRTMPIRQNFSTSYYEFLLGKYVPKSELFINYSQDELLRANKTALIIKYDDGKPWEDSACFRAKDWFYHEGFTPLYDDLIKGKVSIIMPVYNAEKYIAQTLQSLVKQTYTNFEIICVDDGSSDKSADIIDQIAHKDRRIRLIKQPNSGAAMARNKGISLADGEYTLILDADDLFEPEMLQTLVKKAVDTSAEIVICRSVGFNTLDNTEQPMLWSLLTDKIPCNPFTYMNMGAYLYSFTKGWAWDKLYSTKLLRRADIKFQNLQNTNDAFFVFSLLTRAQSMAIVEDVLVRHRRNDSSSISNNRVKNWYCFYQAISAIKSNLLQTGVYKKVERAFVNWVLNFVLWYVRTEPYPLKNYLYLLLKGAIFNEFNINGHEQGYFINKEDYELYLTVQSIPSPGNLHNRLAEFYSQGINFEASSLEDLVQLDLAGMQIKKARRGSFAYEGVTVPVALSCNENYAKYTAVTIQSLIENIDINNKYEIYVLHTELKKETIAKLEKLHGVNYFVKCIDVEEFLPAADQLYVNEHITKEAYYRFCIPEVIKSPKVLYLDCDIIVLDDVAKLFIMDTKGAAISGVNNFMNKNVYTYVADKLRLNPNTYINSGVLLIDSKKYIDEDIKAKFIRLVKNEYRFLDQDIINIICKGKITLLPDKWNFQWHNHNEKNKLVAKQTEYDVISKNPSILHFTTRRKAWNTPNWDMAERFWYYASHTAFFEEIITSNKEAVSIAKYDVRYVPDWRGLGKNSDVDKNKLSQLQAVYDGEVERIANKLKRVDADLNAVHNSISFKIGRFIIWFPRKVRGCLRCLKHNGVRYTLVRIFRGRKAVEHYKAKIRIRKIRG